MTRLCLGLLFCLLFLDGFASDTMYVNKAFLGRYRSQEDLYRWRFINGDDPRYATPEWNHGAAPLTRPSLVPTDENRMRGDAAWYRAWLLGDKKIMNQSIAFSFEGYGRIAVYMDGNLLASLPDQKTEGSAKLGHHPIFFSLPDTLPHLIAIRYQKPPDTYTDEEGFEPGFDVRLMDANDAHEANMESQQTSSIIALPVGSTMATLFVVHLLMFLFYRHDISNLYFALFNLGCTIFLFAVYLEAASDINIAQSFLSNMLLTGSCVLACYSISAFCTHLFGRRKIFLRIIGVLCALMVLATLLYRTPAYVKYIEMTLAVLATVTCVYVVAIFIGAIFRKVPGSGILGGGILFTIFFIVAVMAGIFFNNGKLSTDNMYLGMVLVVGGVLAIFSIPLSISAFLAWRYAGTSKNLRLQLENVAALSEKTIRQEKEKQQILENQNAELEKLVAVRTEEIVQEKQKSDNLLLNILPQEVAEELKAKGESKAQYYDNVSVLFTDLVNFTPISEKLGVEELLAELNVNFTAFDQIMEKYGLEKIKTIGDAYLAVSGLPVPHAQHAQNAVRAAQEILQFVEHRKQQTRYGIDIRIGINSGPLVAGIIGVKKFAYDIWGDTVNTAARMEQNSAPGKINISEQTYQLVKNDFNVIHRGKIEVKGKGPMDMYFLDF